MILRLPGWSMRVLVVSIGTTGDVLPFIAFGAEMKARGHDVTLACAEVFGDAARRAGLDFEPLIPADQYRAVFEHPDFWRPFVGARRLFRALPALMKPTYDFIRRHRTPDTVVVASALALGARVAQETLDVPVVSMHLTPIFFISRHEPPRTPFLPLLDRLPGPVRWRIQTGLYTEFITPLLRPGLNAFRASLGLAPKRGVRTWWHSATLTVLLFPDWFAPRQPDWPKPIRQFDFPSADLVGADSAALDPRLEAFLSDGEPPVVVTFGSARLGSDRLYREAVEASRRLGRRCLVLSPQPLPASLDARDGVFVASYAPLSRVLPRAAALVHHGGVGTVALALAGGTPQLVVPIAFDQFDHAARVRRLGCGVSISRTLFSARRAAPVLERLLSSPAVAQACAEAAARAGDGAAVAQACDAIEAGFGGRRPPFEQVARSLGLA